MGLFQHKKTKEPVTQEEEIKAYGWDAITEAFQQRYPEQSDPIHYGTLISWQLGGNDPLQGISAYDAGEYYHFVSYGLSDLYEKESKDPDYSGYGFEFTLNLRKQGLSNEDAEIRGICGIFQALARITFEKGEIFQPYEYIYTGQKEGVDAEAKSAITGFITTLDELGNIDTVNGRVTFVQLIGMQDEELKTILTNRYQVKDLLEMMPDTLTDYTRKSILETAA